MPKVTRLLRTENIVKCKGSKKLDSLAKKPLNKKDLLEKESARMETPPT